MDKTYDCQVTGYPQRERRSRPRPHFSDAVEHLFWGFNTRIENEDDAYIKGWLTAMRGEFDELMRGAVVLAQGDKASLTLRLLTAPEADE